MGATYSLAEAIAGEIRAALPEQRGASTARADGCSFKWQPFAAPKAAAGAKVSALTLAWRAGAMSLRDLQRRHGGAGWQHEAARATGRILQAGARAMTDPRRTGWCDWVEIALHAIHTEVDRARLGQLGAMAAVQAKRMTAAEAAAARVAFKSWLHEGPAAGLGRQHRFTRVSTGWVPSARLVLQLRSGELDGGDDVPELDPADGETLLDDTMTDEGLAEQPPGMRPASLQEMAEQEALAWGAEWLCGAESGDLPWPADMGDRLPQLSRTKLVGALRSFPAGTGLGWDKMHPRAWLRLGDGVADSLLRLFEMVESAGRWPTAIGHVLVMLLAKTTGGFRPIGLFPSVVRVWMRIRLADAAVWQSLHERPWLFASSGKGAEVAAWKQAARSEQAAARGMAYAAVLLDLVKAFERVPHDLLVRQARALGYNLRLLRLSLAGYGLPRAIVIDGVCSREVVATRGITAGAGHAVIELRLLLSDLWDRVHALNPVADLTVYVDDTGIEARGSTRHILRVLPAAVKMVAVGIVQLRMELSGTKCVACGSSTGLAQEVAAACRPVGALQVVKLACSLGVGLAGGRRPATHVLRKRLAAFKKRLPRFAAIRRLAVSTAKLLRTGGAAGLTYGQASVGVSPSLLHSQRTAVAKALGDRTGGGDLDLSLAVADGARGGMADPAFQAHLQPIVSWARAVWEGWVPTSELLHTAAWAVRRLTAAKNPWAVVSGPATATVATMARLGWRFRDGLTMVTAEGIELVLTKDPPARVAELVRIAVSQWRWARVENRMPQLRPRDGSQDSARLPSLGPCWRPIARLLDPSVRTPGWTAELRGALRSAVTNRQWPHPVA